MTRAKAVSVRVEPIYKTIGKRIQTCREARGMTQDRLGELLGMTRASVCNMEQAKQRIMTHVIYRIAKHLDVSARKLFP